MSTIIKYRAFPFSAKNTYRSRETFFLQKRVGLSLLTLLLSNSERAKGVQTSRSIPNAISFIALVFFTVLTFVSCQNNEAEKENEQIVHSSKIDIPEAVKIKYATCFSLVTEDNVRKIQIKNPFKNYETQQTIVLLPQGSSYQKQQREVVVSVPVQSIVPFSASYISMIDTLGALETVLGIDNKNYIYNPKLQKRIQEGKVKELGNISTLNLEQMATLHPQVIVYTGYSGEDSKISQKLTEMGIANLLNYDWKEIHPLGRAEWIKFFGALYGKEQEANQIFEYIEQEYLKLKEQPKESEPQVLFNSLYNGVWYVPGGESYVAQLVVDAGGIYPWASNESTGSLPLSFEAIVSEASTPDVWLNSNFSSIDEMLQADERYSLFLKSVGDRIFNQTKRLSPQGGNDYFETGVLRPDIVLNDYIQMFQNKDCTTSDLYFFTKLKD